MANRFLSANSDELPLCPGCQKEVYPKDRPLAILKGTWHPGCLKCTTCKTQLAPRSMESYQNLPYCRAHKPSPSASAIADRRDIKQAMTAPKAAKKEQGIDKSARMTFIPGQAQAQSTAGVSPHSYSPGASSASTATRKVQGVNKTERMTFSPNQVKSSAGGSGGYNPVPQMRNMSVQEPVQETYEQSYEETPSGGGYEETYTEETTYQVTEETHEGGYAEGGAEEAPVEGGAYDENQAYNQEGGYYEEGQAEGGAYDENQYYDENAPAEGQEQWQE